MPFLVTVEAHDLGHIFSSSAFSTSDRGETSVLLTLVLLLIQTSMLFLLSLSLLVGSLTTFGGQGVKRLWCRRQREFFDKVVAKVSGERGL